MSLNNLILRLQYCRSFVVCNKTLSAGALEYTNCISVNPLRTNESPVCAPKKSDSKAHVMLELWGMRSTPSLPSLPDPIWARAIAPVRVLSIGQIELLQQHLGPKIIDTSLLLMKMYIFIRARDQCKTCTHSPTIHSPTIHSPTRKLKQNKCTHKCPKKENTPRKWWFKSNQENSRAYLFLPC